MSKLKENKTGEFPLYSSLFWDCNGKIDSTWGYLARNNGDSWRHQLIRWHKTNNLNTMIFLTYNRDPNCHVNPFIQTYGPNVDWAEAAKWLARLEPGKHGANLIPCLFCDDDPGTARNIAFQNYYVPAACVALGPYSRAICLGLEMTEQFSNESIERIVTICRSYTDKPLVIHAQWNRASPLPRNIDGLIYEHDWHPKYGEDHSADEVAGIGADVIAKAGMPVGFNEYNLTPWTTRGREQTRALAKLPCFMIGGPM